LKPGSESPGPDGSNESNLKHFCQKCPGRNGDKARKNPVEKERIRERERKEGPGREGQARETMRDLETNKNKTINRSVAFREIQRQRPPKRRKIDVFLERIREGKRLNLETK
jgi:hypothetical protein